MGKYIISKKILNVNYVSVALKHAEYLLQKSNVQPIIFQNELNNAQSREAFKGLFYKYFGDEVKLID